MLVVRICRCPPQFEIVPALSERESLFDETSRVMSNNAVLLTLFCLVVNYICDRTGHRPNQRCKTCSLLVNSEGYKIDCNLSSAPFGGSPVLYEEGRVW